MTTAMIDCGSAATLAIESIASVRDLTKRYGSYVAVDGISFEVRPGETFGLLGPARRRPSR
jgi:ABC-type sugar transport system ATPase subunit